MLRHPAIFPLLLFAVLFVQCRTEPASDQPTVNFKRTTNDVYVRLPTEPGNLNPLLYRSGYEAQIIEQLYSYLMDFSFDPETSSLQPVLVRSAPTVTNAPQGGKVYRYQLRPEARWDNGTPITAADVEFTLKTLFAPTMPTQRFTSFLDFLVDVRTDANDPLAFEFVTSRPYIIAEEVLGNVVVLPKYAYDPDGRLDDFTFAQLADAANREALQENAELVAFAEAYQNPDNVRSNLTGSGPYRLKEWTPEQRVVLERKADWWGSELDGEQFAAAPEQLIFLPIADEAALTASIYDEGFDVSAQINSKVFLDLQQNEVVADRYNFFTPLTYQTYYMGMNTRSPKLADKRVRQALAHTIDIQTVIDKLFYGFATPTNGLIDSGREYYHRDLPIRQQDFDRARRLLAEAGWTDSNGNGTVDKVVDGVPTELELTYFISANSTYGNNFAQYLREQAQRVGIAVTPEPQAFRQMIGRVQQQDFELAGLASNYYSFYHDLRQLLHTEADVPGGANYTGFGNEETDRLLEEIQASDDASELRPKYLRLQEIFYDETPMTAAFNPQNRIVVHKRFEPVVSPRRPGFNPADFELREEFTRPSNAQED